MATYEQHARSDWSNTENPREYPGNERMVVGCLQRIAAALEGIRDRLDPGWRKDRRQRVTERAALDVGAEEGRRLRKLWRPIRDIIETRVRVALKPLAARLPVKHRQGVRDLSWRVCAWLEARHLYDGAAHRPDREPTTADAERAKRAADAFDPLTFDWDALKMGPVVRQRLREAVRIAAGADGVPATPAPDPPLPRGPAGHAPPS